MDGTQLRALREYHGVTQAEVAHAAGLFQSDISAIESGRKTSEALRDRVAEGILRATTPSRVLARHGDAMRTWLESQGIGNVRVFGSTARGQDTCVSDIDLVGDLPEDASLFDVIGWEEHLRRIAGGVRVDLVASGPGFTELGTAEHDAVAL